MALQITKQIANNYDDIHATPTHFYKYENSIQMGWVTTAGLRFTDIAIPRYSEIVSAYVKVKRYWANEDSFKVKIRARDFDGDYDNWGGVAGRTGLDALSKTSAGVDWDGTWSDPLGTEKTSPDIKTVIQEIIDRGDWDSGSAISIMLYDDSSPEGDQTLFRAHDSVPANSAKLEINYKLKADSSRNARITGKTTANSSREAKITGGVANERSARITGKVASNSSREARITGKTTANSTRAARITGQIANERSARITGTAGWYHPDWTSRKKITIDKDKVDTENQTNFPILINLTTDAALAALAQADGDDILFTADDATTKLSHEIETFETSDGELVAWVKIPTLSSSDDTIIYMYYGNASCGNQENVADVWSNDFTHVYHLKDGTTNAKVKDSVTGAEIDKVGAASPAEAAGQIGKAQDFDGADDYITCGDLADIDGATELTITAWTKFDANNVDYDIFTKGQHGVAAPVVFWRDEAVGSGAQTGNANALSILIYDGATYAWAASPTDSLNDTDWHYVGATYKGGIVAGLKPYVDGVNVNNDDTEDEAAVQSTEVAARIGIDSTGANDMAGLIDELRIATTVRAASWIKTEFTNQSAPSDFYSLGSEETRVSERSAYVWGGVTFPSDYFGWGYRELVTIQHGQVAADEDDFTALIKITSDAGLAAHAKADGSDIVFTDEDGVKLKREIEEFDEATGELIIWVKCDVKADTDTKLYMYFGNAAANETNDTDAWDSDFKAVWHMTDVTTSTIEDSTANNNDGTKLAANQPNQIDGKIHKAQDFDGSDDKIDLPTASLTLQPANLTFEAWIYRDTDWSGIDDILFFAKTEDTWNTNGFYIQIKGAATAQGITLVVNGGNYTRTTETNPNNLFPLDEWCHLVIQWNSTTDTATCKINNVNKEMTTKFGTPTSITASDSQVKRFGPANVWSASYLNAGIDEARIHATDRDADWLTTNYNNQNAPADFFTLGDAEKPADYTTDDERSARVTGKVATNDTREARITGKIAANSVREARVTGKTTADSTREARIHGKVAIHSNRSARIHGKTTGDSSREARITGVAVTSERDARITGGVFPSVRDARITGKDTDNSARDARITGKDAANSEREARITGKDTANSERAARIRGEDTANSERATRITGKATANSTREARITGKDTANSSRSARIAGKTFTDERDARITGKDTANSEREARVHGRDTGNSERDAGIKGQDTTQSTRDARILGQTTANSVREARIHGEATGNSVREARITGKAVTSERDGRITGKTTGSSSRDARITGKDTANSEREARIHGQDTTQDTREARIIGQTTANSVRNARITGKDTGSSARDARVTGESAANSERGARITGVAAQSTRGARVTGKDTDDSTRDARITGISFGSERSARITGYGIASGRDARVTGEDTSESDRSATITGVAAYSERAAQIRGEDTDSSERSATITGVGEVSERDARIHGKVEAVSSRAARITGVSVGSERSANIVGAKCPWYAKEDVDWQSDAKPDWYTPDPQKIHRQSRKVVC